MAIVTGEAPLKDAEDIAIFDSNPAVFYIEGLVFEIDLNSTCTGILEAIGQELLDDDQKPLAIGNDGLTSKSCRFTVKFFWIKKRAYLRTTSLTKSSSDTRFKTRSS